MTDKKLYTGKITIHEVFVEKPPGWFRKIGDGPWESVSLVPYNGMLPVVWMKPSAEPGLQQRETWSDPRVLAEAREGSLRTPAAPQIAERIACQLDIDEPGTSPETHAYNVRWITAIIESARGEASQPSPPPVIHNARFGYLEPEAQPVPTHVSMRHDFLRSLLPIIRNSDRGEGPTAYKIIEDILAEAQPAPQPPPPLGFWEYLEANREVVRKWPGWVKGERAAEATAQPSPGCGKMSYASQSSAQTYGPCHLPRGREGKCSPLIEAAASPSAEPATGAEGKE